jgi:hypothetical protein
MSYSRVIAIFTTLSLAGCVHAASGQGRGRQQPSPRPTATTPQAARAGDAGQGEDRYWAAQRSIEAAIQQLEAYLRSAPDGGRAATARRQLEALKGLAASAALPAWVRMRDLPLSEVPEWRVASVEALPDETRLVIEIACRRGNGRECRFRPFDSSPLVLIDDAGRHHPMLDGGELPGDVRREDREGSAAIGDGRTTAVMVVFAPLARGATGGQVYYRDRNEAVPARFKLTGRR